MSKLDIQRQRNNVARFVCKLVIKQNVIYLNTHNSHEHELIKFEICYALQKQGKHYITEAPLSTNKHNQAIADILCLDDGIAYEIMISETLEQCQYKASKMPNITVIGIRSFQDFKDETYIVIKEGFYE